MADYFRKAKSLYSSTTNSFGTGEGETITPSSVAGLPTDTQIVLTFDRLVTGKLERILGTISGGNFVVASGGRGYDSTTEQAHTSPTVEYINNAADINAVVDGISIGHTQLGVHKSALPLTSPVLTTPKVITSINDTNGNELFKVTATGSAVNELTVANGATGVGPTISATGETNVDLNLQTSGTGVYNLKGTSTAPAEVRLFEDTDNGTNYMALKAPSAVTASKTLTLPDGVGSNGQVLTTNGTDTLSWSTPTSNSDGWVDHSAYTWTYASASTFTIAGVDLTSTFTKGTKLKFTQTTVKYAVVVSSSFSTNTTVTIAVNTSYTIANAAITAPYYSYTSLPQGYPSYFSYTPTFTGFSADPTVGTAFFSVNGGICHVFHTESAAGTSNATSFTITTPVAPNASVASNGVSGLGQGTDNGSNLTAPISIFCTGGSTTLTLYKDIGGTAWTNTGNKRATNISIFYPI